jgi:hypothetical protein
MSTAACPPLASHRVVAADRYQLPRPYRAFAVRSEESRHAWDARAPWGQVHLAQLRGLDADSLARLAAEGRSRVHVDAFPDIEHAPTTFDELALAAPQAASLGRQLATGLQLSGVLGGNLAPYERSLEARIDFLVSCGAGFHNDVSRHWSRCLFWLLVLEAVDVNFVMPHAGVQFAVAPGQLIVFDQTMAHGLCRPADSGQAMAASFDVGAHRQQVFLTGELRLSDAQWAALGSPWLPVDAAEHQGALDLMVAEFDERSGAIKRPGALADGMKRSTCHVDDLQSPSPPPSG